MNNQQITEHKTNFLRLAAQVLNKLIDAIGDTYDIEIYLKKFLQLEEDIEICWRE